MNDLAGAAGLLALIVIVVILIGGVMGFARWAVSRLVSGAVWSVRALLWLIAAGSRWLAGALQRAATYAALMAWRACRAVFRKAGIVLRDSLSGLGAAIRGGWKASSAGREEKTADPSSEGEAESPDDGAAGDDTRDAHSEAEAAYRQALAVMGLTGVEPLTNALLRQRYGELIRIVHPGNGFPSNAFAQQINAAVMTIRKAHGWR